MWDGCGSAHERHERRDTMGTWTTDELDRIGAADELRLASSRSDGTLRPAVTIWVVRVGDDVVGKKKK